MTSYSKLREILLPLALLVAAATAMGTPIPAGLNPGDEYRLVFVSSGTVNGMSADINFYNSLVDGEGDTVLSSDWKAILSTTTISASDNIGAAGVPIYNMVGDLVATSDADFPNAPSLINPISYDENGNFIYSEVWTGAGFPLGSPFTGEGLSTSTDAAWRSAYLQYPDRVAHVYGISSVFTVPTPETGPTPETVPDDSSVFSLLCLALVGIGSIRRFLR